MKIEINRKNIPLLLCLPLAFCLGTTEPEKANAFTSVTVEIPDSNPVPIFVTKKIVDLSYLKEPTVGGLVGAYIGIKGKLPKQAELDFRNQLRYLWDKKLEISGVSPATQKSADNIVNRYSTSDPEFKGIEEFVDGVENQINIAYSGIDFNKYCDRMDLSITKCQAIKSISSNISGKHIVAYGMTELFPSKSGKFNYILLDTLLRNAGESYIQSIPALGDRLLSVGFYQFTYHAVRHDATNIEGASIVNLFVSDEANIGGSVVSLTNEEQHRAAFFFAVYNITRVMNRLSDSQAKYFASSKKCKAEQITQFIATAHHLPTLSIKKASQWIKDKCRDKYPSYLGPTLKEYAKKTKNNLNELERRI